MKVSIIIPSFNSKSILEKNLPEILASVENKKNNIFEIIIVDDGSTDETAAFLTKEYKGKIRLIKHVKNRGFSSAVNTGVRASKGDLILLLNTDVVPEKDFLEPIFKHFEDPKVFAVSCHEEGYGAARGYFKDGYIQLGMEKEDEKVHQSLYVSGGSGIFKKKIWQELGGMDEKLLSPFYWEDIDICYRALKRGYLNLWEPKSKVVHQHESTISKFSQKYVSRIRERNQLLFMCKNIQSKNLMNKHTLGVFSRILKHPGYLVVVFMALIRFPIALKERRKELKESIVSDEAILAMFS